MLKLLNISKSYKQNRVIENFSYEFSDTGFYTLLGNSGCGKTTLLNIISLIDQKYDGKVIFNNKNVSNFFKRRKEKFRINNIGYVFQNFNLFNLDSVVNNVLLPLEVISNQSKEEKIKRALDILDIVELKKRAFQKVSTLSGGEKQRVCIARALINNPKILLCDEPTGALDEKTSKEVFKLLKKISKNILVIVVTHDRKLSFENSDTIIELKDGKISNVKNNCSDDNINNYGGKYTYNIKNRKTFHVIPFSFKIKHIFSIFSSKKGRMIITNLMTTIGLLGIGLTILISSSLSKDLKGAFSSVIDNSQIVVKRKNDTSNLYGNVISANNDDLEKIKEKYENEVDGIGVNYLIDFESFFTDLNYCYFSSVTYKKAIDKISARTFNDYLLVDDQKDYEFYPEVPFVLENDQIVLGLPYSQMVQLANTIGTRKSYEEIGSYIKGNGLILNLVVSNEKWGYDDEESFSVVSICQSQEITIYHKSKNWNEWLFETKMRLPSSENVDNISKPWVMNKISYLYVNNLGDFIEKTNFDKEMRNYIFEMANHSFYPLRNIENYGNRLFVYCVDKNDIDLNLIQQIVNENKSIINYLPLNDAGYSMYSSSFLMGFPNNFYVSNTEKNIDYLIDLDSNIEISDSINNDENFIYGNFMKSSGGGLTFSSKIDGDLHGEKAKNLDEITISSSLSKKLNLYIGDNLYVVYCNNLYEKNLENYSSAKIKIVGIVDNESDRFYSNPTWTIDFFKVKLKCSGFSLLPRFVILNSNEEKVSSDFLINLSKKYTDLDFSNPTEDVSKTIDETLDMVTKMLLIFSSISLAISAILFVLVIYLNIIENKEEIKLFKFIGISDFEITKTFTLNSFLIGFLSFLTTFIQLIIFDLLFNKVLSSTLTMPFKFSVSLEPIVIIFALSSCLSLIIGFIVSYFSVKHETRKILMK